MALIRWTPGNLSQMFDEDNMFDLQWPQTAIDVYEEPENVVVKAQLPGFDEDHIKITVEGSTLTIRGEVNEESEEKDKKYYRKEIRKQSVVRSITLPTPVSSDKAAADFKNGILTLTLPKAEEAKPKEITLKKLK